MQILLAATFFLHPLSVTDLVTHHECSPVPMEEIEEGDLLVFGSSEEDIWTIDIYSADEESFKDQEYPYSAVFRLRQDLEHNLLSDNATLEDGQPPMIVADSAPKFLTEQFDCYYVNEQHIPLVISPKGNASLTSFQAWAEAHQSELKATISDSGALLLRNFPLESAQDFASAVRAVIGRQLIDYRGGEGSRKKVADGVYTSTEAPPQFHIPLHNELSCTNNPPEYICFYCDIAPESGSGQTILGITESITQEILKRPDIWNFFNGHSIRYISRHPPEGSLYSKVNKTHKTWPQVFETQDKNEVDRICKQKGLEYQWIGDWIEVIRVVPAIQNPNPYFDHPYWFNQVHLYHANPRIRGGWINHILANLLYFSADTHQYDIELEDGTAIPREIIYGIYDVLEQQTIKFNWKKEMP